MNINEAALRHLANRSRTALEMKRHLAGKGFDEEEIRAEIEELKSFGYIDDSRYCQEYFRYAFGKGKGKRKVFSELREKGIDPEMMEIAFEDFQEEEGLDERARAFDEARKVLRMADIDADGGDEIPEKVLARIGRKLQSKGYDSGMIYSVIGELRR